MTEKAKRRALTFLFLAGMTVLLLAAALPQMELLPGIPLPFMQEATVTAKIAEDPILVITANSFFKIFLAAIMVSLGLVGVYSLLKKATWSGFLKGALITAGLVAAVLLLLFTFISAGIKIAPVESEVLPPAVKTQGPPLAPLPPELIWLVWIGLALLIGLLVLWYFRRKAAQRSSAEGLRWEAEQAMQALINGQNFSSVIIRCYWQMCLALDKEQGIKRREAMTAREFESLLESKGFPRPPILELTRLFEVARYGARRPNPEDEQSAFTCLNAIVQFKPIEKRSG